MNLFCSGSPLEDEVNLAALENLTVDLTIPLLGGKVHGSLARAGKVRGQTPKVSTFILAMNTCDDTSMHHSKTIMRRILTTFYLSLYFTFQSKNRF